MKATKRCYQHQPGKLYEPAKTHKSDNIADVTVDNLKFLTVIAKAGAYKHNAAQVIASYLKLLSNNKVSCTV